MLSPAEIAGPAALIEKVQTPHRLKRKPPRIEAYGAVFSGSDRRRSGDLTIFSRTLYQLSYRARHFFSDMPRRRLHLNFFRRNTPPERP